MENPMTSGSRRQPQEGFTYILAMFAVAVAGLLLAVTSEVWSHSRQREKEQELLFIGGQFRDAIALYYQRTPGMVKRYPEKLDDMMEDKRYLSVQRYLRQIYTDPFTGTRQWGIVPAPGGGIMGVYSLSEQRPIKTGNFENQDEAFDGSSSYTGWKFIYVPPAPQPSTTSQSGNSQSPSSGMSAPQAAMPLPASR
jgi:type II secretory pathway pseudopilin PulG